MADVQKLNIDISSYQKLRAEGAVRVIKINGNVHYAQKRFDPVSGAPIPVLSTLDRGEVEAQRAALAALADACTALLADIDAAQEV